MRATALWITALATLSAQSPGEPPDSPLFAQAQALDRDLFDAYNRCDLPKFESLLDPNLEFFHDQGGLTRGAKTLTESVEKNICGKVRRTLVVGSMKVYPMKGIGFLQTAVHRFCQIQKDGTCPVTGEAQFTHLWQRTGDRWHLLVSLSYDHRPKGLHASHPGSGFNPVSPTGSTPARPSHSPS